MAPAPHSFNDPRFTETHGETLPILSPTPTATPSAANRTDNLLSPPATHQPRPRIRSRPATPNAPAALLSPTNPTSSYEWRCTFCWLLYPSTVPSRMIGSTRISCLTCWVQIHQLCICWVCLEEVCGGDASVSFGWVFWHRVGHACSGCLREAIIF